MLIEILIGGSLALGFFLWQYDIRKKRREHGQASFVTGLSFLKEKIQRQKSSVELYYKKQMKLEEVEKEHDLVKNTTQYLKFAIGISHDSMDTSIIKEIELVCTFAELPPITIRKDLDSEHCDTIITKIDELFSNSLKKAKKLFDEVQNESRKKALASVTK